ncbi:DNA polymerase I [Flavilitoribacter nigricans]|uniref:DNA polymerase I n=1 Tax=Flavilitoribacter nigricans (strain ATCC 23147 / DSM 23189 / NBRC 102662 / NCIMB 1420 / SS-2) TaxID=1122177 RepID=A0A2D0N756_FLAN2|nr:DNA polymerase I [Flavilitoribacter nigricans]PHN04297.1 DNA polymerase I [Flavilitoribacter nigricans DSM 23189 = NBRC 102662]
MSEKKLFLLDGHALVYRAHFAFITRPLINSKGVNTSAMTGFTRTLWDLMQNQNPTHIAVAFDPSTPTFRHEMYEPYKANREEQPQDIAIALPYVHRIVEGFNIPIVMKDGYEADDVIGTLAKQAEAEGFKVYMVTPDKDYGQLVSENIFLYKPSRQGNGVDIMGEPEICEKWNIQHVDQVIDMLGLMGDSVDNIPGIPGIGEKTAAKLLGQFDSIENLIANSDQLKGKQKERVEEFSEQALLSKKLATIDIEVPIQFDAKTYIIDPINREALTEVFKELEFRSLAKQILGGGADPAPKAKAAAKQGNLFGEPDAIVPLAKSSSLPKHSVADKHLGNTEHDYHLVDSPEARADLIKMLSQQKVFCFDTETTGIDANAAEMVGMSFAVKAGEAYYVPVPEDQDDARALIGEFKAVFENDKIAKIGQNIKYDVIMLKWYDVEVKGHYFDTMVMHYLMEPELRHNMDYLSESYLKYRTVHIETLIGKRGKNQLTMRDVAVERVKDYAAEDADITYQLYEFFLPNLEKEGLKKLYDDVEEPLIEVLAAIEKEGININVDFLKEYSKELSVQIEELEKSVYEAADTKFNLASPKQVGEVLFGKMEIPYRWRRTKTGQYSTDEEKLTELSAEYPLVADILKHRGLSKLRSTYVDALPLMVNPRTGRIHSSFNQTIAATGRLSSNNPNLQNIPIRTPEGAKVRQAFIPRSEDFVLLAADYSQIELRLIAEISGDEAMLEAFQKGQDIHAATAARVFDVPYDEVEREQRYRAKTVNFSIIYGAGATNLSRQLNIKRTEAQELINNYFRSYPGLKKYMDDTVENARKNGFVTTLLGRKRYLRDIDSRSSLARSNAERIAINTPIQGTAADMIKMAMIHIHEIFEEKGFRSRMILQVHDELVFDAHKDELETIKPIIEEQMKNALPGLKVPILVGMGEGKDWLEAH